MSTLHNSERSSESSWREHPFQWKSANTVMEQNSKVMMEDYARTKVHHTTLKGRQKPESSWPSFCMEMSKQRWASNHFTKRWPWRYYSPVILGAIRDSFPAQVIPKSSECTRSNNTERQVTQGMKYDWAFQTHFSLLTLRPRPMLPDWAVSRPIELLRMAICR